MDAYFKQISDYNKAINWRLNQLLSLTNGDLDKNVVLVAQAKFLEWMEDFDGLRKVLKGAGK